MLKLLPTTVLLGFLFPSLASACSCGVIPFHERIGLASDITHIKVVELENKEGRLRAYFEVVESFKGDPNSISYLIASINPQGPMCQVTVEKGEELILFSNQTGPLALHLCDSNIRLARKPGYAEVLQRIMSNDAGELLRGKLVNSFGGLYLDNDEGRNRIIEWPVKDFLTNEVSEHIDRLRSDKIPFEIEMLGYKLEDGTIYWLGVPN